jgi:hypothetical protein
MAKNQPEHQKAEIREVIADETLEPTLPKSTSDDELGARPSAADSEADNGLERNEENLREIVENSTVKPRKSTDATPVFDRGDLPPKI